MFRDLSGKEFKKIFIACGYVDLRKGISGLSDLINYHYNLDPLEKGVLFLFCGRRANVIKGLLWEGDGYLLFTKTLSHGRFHWPRNTDELKALSPREFQLLISGFSLSAFRKAGRKVSAA